MSAAFIGSILFTLGSCAVFLAGPTGFDGRVLLVFIGGVAVALTAPAPAARKGRRSK